MGKEYIWGEAIPELLELIPNNRKNIFGIKTEEFLNELLNGETHEVLRHNHDKYYLRYKKIEGTPFLSSIAKLMKDVYVPNTVFLFDNIELPKKYRKELEKFKANIKDFHIYIKKGKSYFCGFKPEGINTDFAILEYWGLLDKNHLWIRNKDTNKVLVTNNSTVFRDYLIHNTAAKPYNI